MPVGCSIGCTTSHGTGERPRGAESAAQTADPRNLIRFVPAKGVIGAASVPLQTEASTSMADPAHVLVVADGEVDVAALVRLAAEPGGRPLDRRRRWRRGALPRGGRAPRHRGRGLRLAGGRRPGAPARDGRGVRAPPPRTRTRATRSSACCWPSSTRRRASRSSGRSASCARSTPSPTSCCWPIRASTAWSWPSRGMAHAPGASARPMGQGRPASWVRRATTCRSSRSTRWSRASTPRACASPCATRRCPWVARWASPTS